MATSSSGSQAATPLLKMRGRYRLIMPWVISDTVLYTCRSLQLFTQIEDNGTSGYERYYEPMGLTQAQYKQDMDYGASLCGLFGDDGSVIYVPDVYIQSYPTQDTPQYSNFVASLIVGPMRSDYNFAFFISALSQIASDTLGFEPEIFIDSLDNSTVLTPEQADALEAARSAAIKNRTTTWAQLQKANAQIAQLTDTCNALAKKVGTTK